MTVEHGHAYGCHHPETLQALLRGLLLSVEAGDSEACNHNLFLVPLCRAVSFEVIFSEVRGAVFTGGRPQSFCIDPILSTNREELLQISGTLTPLHSRAGET